VISSRQNLRCIGLGRLGNLAALLLIAHTFIPAIADTGGVVDGELSPEMEMSLAELLASPDEALQPEGRRCLPSLAQYNISILDEGHLLVRGLGKRTWLNRLRGRCVGMRPEMILITERRGSSRQCEMDTVYAAARNSLGVAGNESARCRLGKFEPITPEHAGVLEVAFEQQRRAQRQQRIDIRREKKARKRARKENAREENKDLYQGRETLEQPGADLEVSSE